MPEYLGPGVYIEEIERGPRPIEGVATSTAAFLGETERGPLRPRLVTSFGDYCRHFGGEAGDEAYLPYAVRGFFENGGGRAYVCRIAGAGATVASLTAGDLSIEAVGPGAWGNGIFVRLSASLAAPSGNSSARFRLQIAYWPFLPGEAPPADPFARAGKGTVEDFDGLVWDDRASPDFYAKRLQDSSALIQLAGAEPLAAMPVAASGVLAGGAEGAVPSLADYAGRIGDNPSGLAALDLDEYREVALVAAPAADGVVAAAIYEHCERNRFRFAAIDCPKAWENVATLDPRAQWDTSYAAYYYPWLFAADLRSGVPKLVPPCGHVLGLYARTDVERGVWKAPANEVVRGITGLERSVTDAVQGMLNPRGVNVIRQFPGRGIRVWGARTLSSNSLWKYVSVRRLFIFLERSIYEGTQWVVFEPNDEKLWTRVKDTIRLFLRTQWRDGALMGLTEDEAFFIACDRSTMTQDDINNGRLICEIGVAPVRPAEFVILRIFQNTAEAQSLTSAARYSRTASAGAPAIRPRGTFRRGRRGRCRTARC